MRDQTAASASTLDLCLRHASSFGERTLPITTNFETSRADRRDHRTIPPNHECYEPPVRTALHPSGEFRGLPIERTRPITTNSEPSRADRRDHRTIPPNHECYEPPVRTALHPSGEFRGL